MDTGQEGKEQKRNDEQNGEGDQHLHRKVAGLRISHLESAPSLWMESRWDSRRAFLTVNVFPARKWVIRCTSFTLQSGRLRNSSRPPGDRLRNPDRRSGRPARHSRRNPNRGQRVGSAGPNGAPGKRAFQRRSAQCRAGSRMCLVTGELYPYAALPEARRACAWPPDRSGETGARNGTGGLTSSAKRARVGPRILIARGCMATSRTQASRPGFRFLARESLLHERELSRQGAAPRMRRADRSEKPCQYALAAGRYPVTLSRLLHLAGGPTGCY